MLQHIQPPSSTQREQLECALVSGAAAHLASHANEADQIAEGIKKVLDKLHPMPGPLKAAPAKRAVTDEMVGRFLSWQLPADFAPDCGISFKRESDYNHPEFGRTQYRPTGTNLLHAGQARAMLEHCINGPFASPITLPVVDPGPDALERAMESKTYPDGTTAFGPAPLPDVSPAKLAKPLAKEVPELTVSLSDLELEREIQAKADKGPRVTPADVEAEISAEYSFTLDKALAGCPLLDGLERVTIAVLVLRNGAKLVGVNYGAIDPTQHSPEMGAKEARAAAVEQIWPLLGFRLRDELARPVLTDADAAADLAGTQRPSQAGAGN